MPIVKCAEVVPIYMMERWSRLPFLDKRTLKMQTQKKLIARIDGVIDLLRHAGVVGTGTGNQLGRLLGT